MEKEDSTIFHGKSKNFREEEFYCGDGCGFYNMRLSFMLRLQYARTAAGIPFLMNSGSRCPVHNKALGGKPDSTHRTGEGGDISTKPKRLAKYGVTLLQSEIVGRIVDGLLEAGFKRIGIYFDDGYIHVDVRNWHKNQKVIIWGRDKT